MLRARLSPSLAQANALRRQGKWQEALDIYRAMEHELPDDAGLKHNIALCCLGAGEPGNAIQYCNHALRLEARLWQSEVIKTKALKELGEVDKALALLASLLKRYPANSEVRLELASLALHELGDSALAQRLVVPVYQDPAYRDDAVLTSLMAKLYDRAQSWEDLVKDICDFSAQNLSLPRPMVWPRQAQTSKARRIGLISPQFTCSPVYFFCIGALKRLAEDYELVILNRGTRADWATQEFRSIAKEWHDLASLDCEALSSFIVTQRLDALIDMGGWMDPHALRAISSRPAKRIYKWVGGQSVTTGLAAFDGMFSDEYQTPSECQPLYVEPLILFKSGYVSYTPPSYMPAASATAKEEEIVLGVISNPAKVSLSFLAYLKSRLAETTSRCRRQVRLRFIDRRYHHHALRSRIQSALPPSDYLRLDFVVPQGHAAYLQEVARLTAVVDTFPYTGGLTTIEALSMGVPCFTRVGQLFSERHTYSHCRYAGMELEQFDLGGTCFARLLVPSDAERGTMISRHSLLHHSCKRLDHQGVAEEISRCL
jgi:protein O-GlcNAc transferase